MSGFFTVREVAKRLRLSTATVYKLCANGSLARLFAFDPSLRRVRKTDFHIMRPDPRSPAVPIDLWLEAGFEFAELKDDAKTHPTIPGHFAHLQLESADGVPRVRLPLEAQLDEDAAEGGVTILWVPVRDCN